MNKYYKGNEIDITTKDQLSGDILNKVVKQVMEGKVFDGPFGVFTRNELGTGFQWEEIETANLTSTDFDPTGANALKKKDMNFKTLYHKINRRKTLKATVSKAQLKIAMLNESNLASAANLITTEMSNSAAIEDYEAFKDLLNDIAFEQKKMVVCDLNDNGTKIDAFVKAVQVVANNMSFPSTAYNFSGFKKEFSKKEDLVLIIDSTMMAKLNVDSLASAFNMDKKHLVNNIIVVDSLPAITYTTVKADAGLSLDIGEQKPILTYKYNSGGSANFSGKPVAFLVEKKAIITDPVERELDEQYNAEGRFTNYFYHTTDVLSYSTLRNAVVFID